MVATPPGCPVFQALRRSSASAPRTSPTRMRSGRKRKVARNRRRRSAASQLRNSTAFSDDLCDDRVGERRLAGAGDSDNDDVLALGHGPFDDGFLALAHNPGRHTLAKRKNSGRLAPDCKHRCRHYRRDQALKPAAIERQLAFEDRVAARDRGLMRGGDGSERPSALTGLSWPRRQGGPPLRSTQRVPSAFRRISMTLTSERQAQTSGPSSRLSFS
jgi:hypothetical protein